MNFAKPLLRSKTVQTLIATGLAYLATKYGLDDFINSLGGSERAASLVTDTVVAGGGLLAGYFRFTADTKLY